MSTEDQQTIAHQVADAVAPAVVRIGRHGGRGCGVVVADGLVVTNAHNLRDRTTEVTFANGRAVRPTPPASTSTATSGCWRWTQAVCLR
jgi:S1-C subfamily serine protease